MIHTQNEAEAKVQKIYFKYFNLTIFRFWSIEKKNFDHFQSVFVFAKKKQPRPYNFHNIIGFLRIQWLSQKLIESIEKSRFHFKNSTSAFYTQKPEFFRLDSYVTDCGKYIDERKKEWIEKYWKKSLQSLSAKVRYIFLRFCTQSIKPLPLPLCWRRCSTFLQAGPGPRDPRASNSRSRVVKRVHCFLLRAMEYWQHIPLRKKKTNNSNKQIR